MYNNDYLISGNPITESGGLEEFLGAATGVAIALAILLVLVVTAIAVVMIVANCKMFAKAGEKWWKGLIPFYNYWVEARIAGLAWWWFVIYVGLMAFAASVSAKGGNYVVTSILLLVGFNFNYNLSKKFGKSDGFAVLLFLLPFIGLPILAFGSAKYDKNASVDKNGIFKVEK